jgi:hypothetical protein
MGAGSKCRTIIGLWAVGFTGYCINGPMGFRFGGNNVYKQAGILCLFIIKILFLNRQNRLNAPHYNIDHYDSLITSIAACLYTLLPPNRNPIGPFIQYPVNPTAHKPIIVRHLLPAPIPHNVVHLIYFVDSKTISL